MAATPTGHAEDAFRFLAEASKELASSLDYEATLRRVARSAVPTLADWCFVDVLDEEGQPRRVEVAHADPTRSELADAFRAFPPRLDATAGIGRVIRTGEPELIPESDDALLQASTRDAEHLRLTRMMGQRSVMRVALAARGRTLGAISFITADSGRRYDPSDLELAEELARRAAVAIDNARLYAAEQRARAAAEVVAGSLGRSEERLRVALEAASMGIWDWDPAVGQVVWSPEVEAIYGLAPGTFDGTYAAYMGMIHPDDRAGHSARIAGAVERGGDFETEHRVIWPDSAIRWVAGRGRAYLDEDGSLLRMTGAVMDVTARKLAEQERAELLAREQAARAEAEAAVHARDRFLSIASHELRTPITTIRAAAQVLLRAESQGRLEAERLRHLLNRIDHSTDHLTALIDDLLDVSRLQSGLLPLRIEPLDLAELAREAVGRFADQVGDGHRITCEVAERRPIEADQTRLEQVLANLLDNAAKYSPEGGEIRVTMAEEDGGVRVEVHDSGIGLPPGAEVSIFEPFERAPNASERQLPGLGLGLYICRMLVERHDGRIWARSEGEGRGTAVGFWLPGAAQPSDTSDAERPGEDVACPAST